MKYNLKNRPKVTEDDIDCYMPESYEYEEWFEGFQKELRDRIYPKWQTTEGALWINSLIKEIFGEKLEGKTCRFLMR